MGAKGLVGMKHSGKTATGAICLHVNNADWKDHFGQHITGQQGVLHRAERTAKLRGRDGFIVHWPVRPIGDLGSNP